MNSIDDGCTELKKRYDACFNTWFKDEYLTGRSSGKDPCALLFKDYQTCVKKAILMHGIDLNDAEKPVLGTDKEKQPPQK